MPKHSLIAALLALISVAEAHASVPDTLRPYFVTTPPVIDGVLDEPFWKLAPRVSNFQTFIPDFGITPVEQTDAAFAYDHDNIYFGVRCYDRPELIKTSICARDNMLADDFVCINLDPANDHQGLNAFYINPQGIQADSRFAADNEDFSPDFVWYSAGRIDEHGYTIEVQIPLKSLRYNRADPTVMGVVMERYISRRNEHSSFPHLDPAKGYAFLTQMQPIAYTGIEPTTLLEVLPAVTATRQDIRTQGVLTRDKQQGDLSLTAKYGITSDLILDGTVNPDFSQVESDAGQIDVNLRYSLYYPEKRPFFLEGIDNYTVASSANLYDPTIYYSRTIVDPNLGTRLTGKTGDRNTIAALYAVDNVLEADRATLGNYVRVPVVRYKRAFANDSYVGGMYAARELDNSSNRVAGVDEQLRVSDAAVLSGSGFLSWAKDDPAIPTQEGHTAGARFASGTRSLDYNLNFREVSENFRADMGYITRTGIVNFIGFLRPKIYPASDVMRRIDLEFTTAFTQDRPSGLWETSQDFAFNLNFTRNMTFRTRFNYSTEVFEAQKFQTSGIHTQIKTQLTKEFYALLLYRRLRAIYYATPEQGKSNVVQATVVLQPLENIQSEYDLTYSDFTRDLDGEMLYTYPINRLKITYQLNKYLSFRVIEEYNGYYSQLSNDLLASYTTTPGTVFYLGYGSIFDKEHWDGTEYVNGTGLQQAQRGLFTKLSYLWRM